MALFSSRVAEVRLAGVTPNLTARSRVISLESFILSKGEHCGLAMYQMHCLQGTAVVSDRP